MASSSSSSSSSSSFLRLANALLVLHIISVCMIHTHANCPPPTMPPVQPPISPPPPVQPPTSSPPVQPPMSPPPPVMPPPTSPPVKPPVSPPTPSPFYPPYAAPVYPTTIIKGVAVQGVVFCRSVCTLKGKFNQITKTALEGAVVKLVCMSGSSKKEQFVRKATSNASGYFFVKTSKLKREGVSNCRVFLVRSRSRECNVPTTLSGGSAGAPLTPAVIDPNDKLFAGYALHNVGPFAFEPAKIRPCFY